MIRPEKLTEYLVSFLIDDFSPSRFVCGTIVNTHHCPEDQKVFLTRLKLNFIKNVK
ncbi:uncharacterized protein SRT_02030 [Streptococcus troglodytae]|uniref:Uncharacterized protein n=1 Tax=Streptococcus troglodytae TaxID=1111760 RepID=A0A1L7LGY0_9STRE|nr:uncharacterized protein SRT_02030 [Streptococcus troglodytae]